jgi:hypothetical protein
MAGPGAVSLELGARVAAARELGGREAAVPVTDDREVAVLAPGGREVAVLGASGREVAVLGPGGRKVVTRDLPVLAALGPMSRIPGLAVREPCELRRHGLNPRRETACPDPLDYNGRFTLRRCRCPFPYLEPVIRD